MDDQKQIFQSLGIIEERIHEKLTVDALAQSLHFSRYHYQRLFREAVGESVMRYVARRRIALAAGELAGTNRSVLEIALRYGFDSHEGFCRRFKAAMGVSPTEYRRHHSSIQPPRTEKERSAMLYSKTADEMLRELNRLIVQARETADYTMKSLKKDSEAAVFYRQFWEFMAQRAQQMASSLSGALERITDIPGCPDQISARFLIIKAIEDAAFLANLTALQARLTTARAMPEHRALLEPICARYEELAGNARMKAGRIADFFNELTALIFQDMRCSAREKLQNVLRKGREAADRLLEDPSLPYGYIAEEILAIIRELSGIPAGRVSAELLEDLLFRMQIIAFTADVDLLRAPSHRPLFEGISQFQEELSGALSFYQGLSADIFAENLCENTVVLERTPEKRFRDMAFQGNILSFYLRGEIAKLGPRLDEGRREAFDGLCGRLQEAIRLACQAGERSDAGKIAEILAQTAAELELLSGELGVYGGPVGLLREEITGLAAAAGRLMRE